MARYWSYLRYSTPEQRLGDSERRQVEAGRQRAVALSAEYVDEYRDHGVSAYRGKNRTQGALAQFIEDAKAGKVAAGDIIGVENVDRLSRDVALNALELITEILRLGINLDVRGQLITRALLEEQPQQLFLLIGEMIRAHSESRSKSERLLAANVRKRQEAREGKRLFGGKRCRAWLRPSEDGRKYEVIPGCEKTVRMIFEWALDGIGIETIARRLNALKIEPFAKRRQKDRQGGWHHSYVRRILRDEAVRGFWQPTLYFGGERVATGEPMRVYPQIISDADWVRVQSAMTDRATRGRGRRGGTRKHPEYSNLVSGLGRCSECGGGLTVVIKGGGYRYLRCAKSRRRFSCENKASFPYDRFEKLLLDLTCRGMPEVIFKLLPEAPKPDEDRIAALTLAIEKKQRRLDAVMEQWSHDESITTQETARRQIKRLSAEIDVDKAELVEARSRARIIQHDDRAGVGDRVQKARSMMLNRDAEIRFQARAKLAQELRHILNSVVLHPDRSFDLRYNDGHLGETLLELSLTTDRIVGVRSMFPDGRTFMQLNDLIAMDRLSFEIGFEAFGILVEAMQNPEVEAPVDG